MKASTIKNNMYALKMMLRISKGRVIYIFVRSLFDYASWVFYSLVFIKFLVGSLETGRSFGQIMTFLLVSALVFAVPAAMDAWFEGLYRHKSDADIFEKVNRLLFEKATRVELECYENTEFYNRFTLAMQGSNERLVGVVQNISRIISSLAAAVFSLVYMFSIDRFVIIFVLGPVIGNFVFSRRLHKVQYKHDRENAPYSRRIDYVNRTVYLADYAKEIRMTPVFSVLKKLYMEGYSGIIQKINAYRRREGALALTANIFTFVIIFQGVMFYSMYRTLVTKSIGISDFAVLFSAMSTVAWIVIGASREITQGFENSLYISNLRTFLEYEPVIDENQEGKHPAVPERRGAEEIAFRGVSFTYRGQEEPTLKNINVSVRRGEKIAIVGPNGSGKTTFIKLLTRLYDASAGGVFYNGTNVKELNLREYRRLYGMAFQDYQVFSLTVAENVLMRKPVCEADYQAAREALTRAGVYDRIQKLPKGMDTVLTREFDGDGAVLSGGELQKIAVARALAGKYSVAVFDEPSSSLDPMAEYRLYESIMEACADKTVIFISHRLSAACLADRIFLFKDGQIAEEGSHEQLMRENGSYADMFRRQAENYRTGTEDCRAETGNDGACAEDCRTEEAQDA